MPGGAVRAYLEPGEPDAMLWLADRVRPASPIAVHRPSFRQGEEVEYYGIAPGDYIAAIVSGGRTSGREMLTVAANRVATMGRVRPTFAPLAIELRQEGELLRERATLLVRGNGFSHVLHWTGSPLRVQGPLLDVLGCAVRLPSRSEGRETTFGGDACILRMGEHMVAALEPGSSSLALSAGLDLARGEDLVFSIVGARQESEPWTLAVDSARDPEHLYPLHSVVRGALRRDLRPLRVTGVPAGPLLVGVGPDRRGAPILWRRVSLQVPTDIRAIVDGEEVQASGLRDDGKLTLRTAETLVHGLARIGAIETNNAEDRAFECSIGRLWEAVESECARVRRVVGYGARATGESSHELAGDALPRVHLSQTVLNAITKGSSWSIRVTRPLCGRAPELVYEAEGNGSEGLAQGLPWSVDGVIRVEVIDGDGRGAVFEGVLRDGRTFDVASDDGAFAAAGAAEATVESMAPLASIRFRAADGSAVPSASLRQVHGGAEVQASATGQATMEFARSGPIPAFVRGRDDWWSRRVLLEHSQSVEVDCPEPGAVYSHAQILHALGCDSSGLEDVALHVVDLRTGEDVRVSPGGSARMPPLGDRRCEVHIEAAGIVGFGWIDGLEAWGGGQGSATIHLRSLGATAIAIVALPRAQFAVRLRPNESIKFSVPADTPLGLGWARTGEATAGGEEMTWMRPQPGDIITVVSRD
jgi:hypothetical protein